MYLSRKLPNIDIEKRELEKQKDSSSLSKQILSVFPVLLFSTEPIKTIDNVSAKQDFQTGIQNLEKRHLNVLSISAGFIAGEFCTGLLDFCLAL